jgi:hypothetical protein
LQTGVDLKSIFLGMGSYYHIGVHIASAGMALLFEDSPGDSLLTLGAFLLAVIPFPLYLLVKRQTGIASAGLWAVLLAGWGWPMPGHAVEWGKYPLLAGMVAGMLALALAYLAYHAHSRKLLAAALFCILAATLFHSRMLVFIAIVLIAYLLANFWARLSARWQWGILAIVFIAITGLAYHILNTPMLSTLFRFFTQAPFLFVTLVVCSLLPFGWKYFPIMVFANILTAVFLMGALTIPIIVPTRGLLTLLDRPFVETVLSMPLAVLGGLGYAGLILFLGEKPKITLAVQFLIWLSVLGIVFFSYPFKPTPCCNFYSEDDKTAMAWINQNLPPDAVFVAAGASLEVFEYPGQKALDGMDAGIWIPVLTRRPLVLLPGWTDFSSQEILGQICGQSARYIYVGSMPGGFSFTQLDELPDWYYPVFSLKKAKIYQVTGCAGIMNNIP